MLKMIIADDEYNVRAGLREVVRWEELGVEVVGDAADGLETYDLCRSLRPDILLTDIRMPMMDGLEAARKLKDDGDPVRIIIISGAEDFQYAKTALSLNADGYILKPIKLAELQQTVRKVADAIAAERSRDARTERLQRQVRETMPVLREKFLAGLTTGMFANEEEIRSGLAFHGPTCSADEAWTAAVLRIDDYEEAVERYSEARKQLLAFSVQNVLDEIAAGSGGAAFVMSENEHVVLFQPRDGRRVADICRDMLNCIRHYLNLSASFGIGRPARKASELHGSYREALAAINYTFYTGKSSVLDISDYRADADGPRFPKLYDAEAKLVGFMMQGMKDAAEETVRYVFDALCGGLLLPDGYARSVCVELVNMADKAVAEAGERIWDIAPGYASVMADVYGIREASGLRETMLGLFGELAAHFARKHTHKNGRTIQKIKAIVAQSYMENVTVQKLSEQVYLSPNYISLVFKQETGESLTEYVTKVRMEAAKELLKSPDLKILEVAEMVGYENAAYFSTVFKKYAGMHPQKYRSLFQAD
ncbi:two-component system, response regulator YesN [Paenibacillus sp. UNC496MF]|uniref:response regulator n=1 Tax=Paenibacillus sp. UNC496MF TaxID=1502753 RepID=UPI0008EC316B|nr:response regulator [Paenibacillus sp. UNC496MF]SFI27399.1 two-component system, response regulator YesN [Paenibacillus sp. UNC496MF]